MVEILDEKIARAWLDEQPHQVRVWFAVRCALRELPGLGFENDPDIDSVSLETFRATIIATAAATYTGPEAEDLETAARAANAAASIFATGDGHARYAKNAIMAAFSASVAAASVYSTYNDKYPEMHSAYFTLMVSHVAAQASYSAAQNDANHKAEWRPLWHDAGMPPRLNDGWIRLRWHLAAAPETWGFWLVWYEAILEGRPLPWELSFRIATTLTGEDWDKGPAHVAERIAEIRQAFDVAGAVSDLRGATETVAADAMRIKRGHNNPPELVDEPELVERTTVIWAALDDLEQEAKADQPDKSKARQALAVVKDWFVSVCAYLGRKADLAIDTAIKWAIPTAGGYLMLNPDKLQNVIELAERWLTP